MLQTNEGTSKKGKDYNAHHNTYSLIRIVASQTLYKKVLNKHEILTLFSILLNINILVDLGSMF